MEDFAHAGTVSAGTLRPEDLVPAFASTLELLADDESIALTDDQIGRIVKLSRAVKNLDTLGIEVYADTDYLRDLTNSLQEMLDDCAPEGWYFGTLEGDGADFGFWRADNDYKATIVVHFRADDAEHAGQRAGAMAGTLQENFEIASARADVEVLEAN